MILSNEYLYGDDVVVPKIPLSIIDKRIQLLNDNLERLLKVDYKVRDTMRCNDIIKAVKFWESLKQKGNK